jgi:hypothetical protein
VISGLLFTVANLAANAVATVLAFPGLAAKAVATVFTCYMCVCMHVCLITKEVLLQP